ncbi:DMT family transporter [Crocinitomix algicola]|uniref:DMT family transporter n=1 Tax=Crocinitomix algicola TaxID=1740263 RepID=UPI0008730306|nr:DMT family transporter [Crocinitomix algicola]
MPVNFKSHLALLVLNLMYGANYVVAKGLMPNVIGANGFILLRVLGATILFWIIYAFQYQKIAPKDFLRLAACGLFGVAINQLFFFNGIMITSPINAPIIMTTTPIIVLVLSMLILKESTTKLKVVGIVLGTIGSVLFTILSKNVGFSTGLGDVFILINAISYSLYLVLVKPLMAKYKPFTVITWVFTFGLIYVSIWPFSWPELSSVQFDNLSIDSGLRLVFVVLGVTFIPYLLTVFAMKKLSPSTSSTYIYFQPIFAASFIYLFYLVGLEDYTQDFTIAKVLCALLIFAGVYLVIRPANKKSRLIPPK